MSAPVDPNVTVLTASIQKLVSQLLQNGNVVDATTSIKKAIEDSSTSTTTAIDTPTASNVEVAAHAKVTADAATARAKPAPIFALHPGTQDAGKILDYSTTHGGGLYLAATAAL
jgi:hypothetical protein